MFSPRRSQLHGSQMLTTEDKTKRGGGGGSVLDIWSRQRSQLHNGLGGIFMQRGHFSFKPCVETMILKKQCNIKFQWSRGTLAPPNPAYWVVSGVDHCCSSHKQQIDEDSQWVITPGSTSTQRAKCQQMSLLVARRS